ALQSDARLVDAHIDLGSLLLDKGDVAEAKNHFQKASNLNPKLAQPHNYLGKSLCGKETSITLSYNSRRHCVCIPTFQKPRKTCASLNRVKRQMDMNETRIFRSRYSCIVFIGG